MIKAHLRIDILFCELGSAHPDSLAIFGSGDTATIVGKASPANARRNAFALLISQYGYLGKEGAC